MVRVILACVACLIVAPAWPQDRLKRDPHELLDEQVKAWNRRDLDGFMAGYWNSPELSFYSGNSKSAGWQALFERYRTTYQGKDKEMGTLAFKEVHVQMLGLDHALARGRWHLTLRKGQVEGLFTLLLKKMPEGWRIVHDHTSN